MSNTLPFSTPSEIEIVCQILEENTSVTRVSLDKLKQHKKQLEEGGEFESLELSCHDFSHILCMLNDVMEYQSDEKVQEITNGYTPSDRIDAFVMNMTVGNYIESKIDMSKSLNPDSSFYYL